MHWLGSPRELVHPARGRSREHRAERGQHQIKVGRFQTYRRWRSIYPGFPAGPWQTTNLAEVFNADGIFTSDGSNDGYFYVDSKRGIAQVPIQGEVHVDFDNGKPTLSLYGDTATFTLSNTNPDPTVAFTIADWDFTGQSYPTAFYQTSANVSIQGWPSTTLTNTLPIWYAGHALNFLANATSTCVRFLYDENESLSDSDGNPWTRESQLVVLGTIGS
jgi:hypothetical protein